MSHLLRRLKLLSALPFMMASSIASQADAQSAPAGDVTISATVNGSTLQIGANPNTYAGTIDSVIFRGVQYVYSNYHGTQFSADALFNNEGQCYNPTEPGSFNDLNKSTSSSILESISNANNVLNTSTNMAFWLAPGQSNGGQECDKPYDTSTVATDYSTIVSNVILNKTVSIGTNGIPNLISVQTDYYVPNTYSPASFIFNGYMPTAFSNSLSYNPQNKTLTPLPQVPAPGAGSTLPIITSTSDGASATGVISGSGGSYAYGYIASPASSSVKIGFWNCGLTIGSVQAGSTNNVNCEIAFGTVDEDIAALNQYSGTSDVTTPIYRFRKAPYLFWTTSYTQGATLWGAQNFNGTAYHVNPYGVSNSTTALYSCLRKNSTADYFASISSTCEGQTVKGLLGYVSPGPGTGLTPLYRFYNSSLGIHLITTSYTEGTSDSGFTFDVVLGYSPIE